MHQGDADGPMPVTQLDLYATAIPHARIRVLAGRDHQIDDDLREVANDIRLRR